VNVRVVTEAERPLADDEWEAVVRPVWPEFMLHDAIVNRHWGWLADGFAEFQLVALDDSDEVVAIGNTIPFAWDGAAGSLPNGIDEVLPAGVEGLAQGVAPTTLCALQAVVRPDRQGRALSAIVIEAMRDVARRHGLGALVAPVRPTLKASYPLAAMERYAGWTREDGLPFDPWLRVHKRLGGEILGVADASMTVDGTVAEWERWAGMAFPESGAYVVPGALVPVEIDRERDAGRYVEPNVWVRHPSTVDRSSTSED
jgi:GNAT superfamily N-acetyltransferase